MNSAQQRRRPDPTGVISTKQEERLVQEGVAIGVCTRRFGGKAKTSLGGLLPPWLGLVSQQDSRWELRLYTFLFAACLAKVALFDNHVYEALTEIGAAHVG